MRSGGRMVSSLKTQLATENTEGTEKKQWVAASIGFTHQVRWQNMQNRFISVSSVISVA